MDRRHFLMSTAASAALGGLAACNESEIKVPAEPPTTKPAIDLNQMDGVEIGARIGAGDITAGEATENAITNIEALNSKINAVVTPTFDKAREKASGAAPNGVFAGVPFLLKDLMDYEGVRMTSGSNLFKDNISDWTPPLIEAFEESGLNILGKTNTPEFGLLATTESLALGPCRNPWNLDHSTGGSSGGSAAAVASGMVPLAQSSDGGGSIRVPASCCGVFGLKPSRGRMKQTSKQPMPGDIGVRHVISRSVRDTAAAHAIGEVTDASGIFAPTGLIEGPSARRLKIAFGTKNYLGDEPDADVKLAIEETAKLCEDLGHEIIPVDNPIEGQPFIDHFLTIWASGPAELKAMIEAQAGVPTEQTGLLEPWTLGLADYFNAKPDGAMASALAHFGEVTQQMIEWIEPYDVWLTPVLNSAPPKIGEQAPTVDFETLYERTIHYVSYTPLHNATGMPGMSVPLSWNENGLPIGSQFAAPLGAEGTLLALAFELEQAKPWAEKRPPNSVWST